MRVRVSEGRDVLDRVAPTLEDLWEATEAPVTARLPWLSIWARHYGYEPWAIVVDGDQGPEAAALLARRKTGGRGSVVGLGHGRSDYARLPAGDLESAERLGDAMGRALRSLPSPWSLHLEQLPAGDPAAELLASSLRWSEVRAGDQAPALVFDRSAPEADELSAGIRREVRKKWNRVRSAGLSVQTEVVADPEQVATLLPDIERIRGARDAMLARRPESDTSKAFRRDVTVELVRRGQAEVATLRFDGELAAYAVCLADRDAYRRWESRFDLRWERFSPGLLIMEFTIRRAREDPRFARYDHMRGTEEQKLRASNHVEPAWRVVAWSSRAMRYASELPRSVGDGLRRWREEHPAVRRAWMAAKRTGLRRGR
jgi:Acetyltransferase (GNAT) domain